MIDPDQYRSGERGDARDEVTRLRFMLQYASEAPDLAAARQVCRDALNGVGGAYNVQAVRSQVERYREVLAEIARYEHATDATFVACGRTLARSAREALKP